LLKVLTMTGSVRREATAKLARTGAGEACRAVTVATEDTRTIDYFCADKLVEKAGLTRAHVLALRLYTSSVSRTVNSKLHDGCSTERRHPYPALVLNLVDAIQKLAVAQSNVRTTAQERAKELAEAARKAKDDPDADDTDKARAAKKAAEAAAASDALQVSVFWRGVHGLKSEEFAERSGFEAGFMSMSKEKSRAAQDALLVYNLERKKEAQRQAEVDAERAEEEEEESESTKNEEEKTVTKSDPPVLLYRVVPALLMPAELSFLAVFPNDAEWAFPPGVVLEHRNEWKDTLGENEAGEKVECTTVELFPVLERKEEGKRKVRDVLATDAQATTTAEDADTPV